MFCFVNSVTAKKDIPSIAVEDAEPVDEAAGSHNYTTTTIMLSTSVHTSDILHFTQIKKFNTVQWQIHPRIPHTGLDAYSKFDKNFIETLYFLNRPVPLRAPSYQVKVAVKVKKKTKMRGIKESFRIHYV